MREQYKMVPVEKLKEWEAAINTIALQMAFDIADDIAQYSCAPTVQVEPVSLRQRLFNGWEGCSNHGCVVVDPKPGMMRTNGTCQCVVNASRSQLYLLQGRIQTVLSATQQPTEQQPSAGDSLTSLPDEAFAVEFGAWWEEHGQFCRAGGGTYEKSFAFEAWRHLYPQLMKLQTSAGVVPEITATFECESNGITGSTAAPVKRIDQHDDGVFEVILDYWPTPSPQPAPDVSALVEALQNEAASLCDAVENINDLPPVTYALQAGRAVNKVRDAVAALAAHRKGGFQ